MDKLVELLRSPLADDWPARASTALTEALGMWPKTVLAEESRDVDGDTELPDRKCALRIPGARDGRLPAKMDAPYAAVIHAANPPSGAYAGTSFVIFPVGEPLGQRMVFGLVVGTDGLGADEAALARPGHARRARALARWLNATCGRVVAWAKQDPTRLDADLPSDVQFGDPGAAAYRKYGRFLYCLVDATALLDESQGEPREGVCRAALLLTLDLAVSLRGTPPKKEFEREIGLAQARVRAATIRSPTEPDLAELLADRRFVIVEGPPGTGKTRIAERLLAGHYGGQGDFHQFHAGVTYESFVGGLAPVESPAGVAFRPRAGWLIRACAAASAAARNAEQEGRPAPPWLLVLDEINRADLARVLGEALALFEPGERRSITLSLRFDELGGDRLELPPNLHVLGTMNSADRSTAIVDLAVRRRFAFVGIPPNGAIVEQVSQSAPLAVDAFRRLDAIWTEHAPDDALRWMPGHSYFLHPDDQAFRLRAPRALLPLLREYLAQGLSAGFEGELQSYVDALEAECGL